MANKKAISAKQFVQVIPPTKPEFRFVVPARYKAGVLTALDNIRMLFGKNGQNWIIGAEHEHTEAGEYSIFKGGTLTKAFDGYCLIGGVYEVDGRYEQFAQAAIALAIMEYTGDLADAIDESDMEYMAKQAFSVNTITSFNDDSASWSDIKAVLKAAKKLVADAPTR